MIELLASIASFIVPRSLYRFAMRLISRGIQSIANGIANYLYRLGYYRAARTVRHIARYLVELGPHLLRFYDGYSVYEEVRDIVEEVDEVEIEGERYSMVQDRYVY